MDYLVVVNKPLPRRMRERLEGMGDVLDIYTDYRDKKISSVIDSVCSDGEYQRLVGVGGDGTAIEVARSALKRGVEYLTVPMGTLNDTNKEFGCREDWGKVLDAERYVAAMERDDFGLQDFDMLEFTADGTDYHALVAIQGGLFGLAADADHGVWHGLKHTPLRKNANLIKGVWDMARSKPWDVELDANGKMYAGEVWVLQVSNCRYTGGGQVTTRDACPHDGAADVLYLDGSVSKQQLPGILSQLAELYNAPGGGVLNGVQEMGIHSDSGIPLGYDGEYIGKVHDVSARVLPGALKMLVPNEFLNSYNVP